VNAETRVVSRGEIRVDARRAVVKLREHLLVDLHAYGLELARAAVASGARELDVRYDSDDVTFAFGGTTVTEARLPQLLSYVLAETEDLREQPLRLLALGVNAALGLGPAFVDVFRCDGDRCVKVRWTPALLAREDAPPPAVTAVARPEAAPKHGTLVHVRRKLGKAVLVNALTGRVPPEIQLLAEHTHETPLRVRLGEKALARSFRARQLLRVPISLPNATRAEVEICMAGSPCVMEICERGVRLATWMWTPVPGLAPLSADRSLAVPARVIVDSDMLSTNASRSALREDSDLMRALPAAAREGFLTAVRALVVMVTGEGKLPKGVTAMDADPLALEGALGAIACVVANTDSGTDAFRELRQLWDVPLLHMADGSRASLASVWGERYVYAYSDKKPQNKRLSPWFTRVVWLRGRTIERALGGISLVDARGLTEVAKKGAERRDAHLSHPASEPSVPNGVNELAREKFRFVKGPLAGLVGEVALLVPRTDQERMTLFRFHVEDRLLETMSLDPSYIPLTFDAALAWPSQVRPRVAYDGVERDGGLAHAMNAVTQIAIGLANRVAEYLPKLSPEERAALEPILACAIVSFAAVPERLGLVPRSGFSLKFPELYRAELLPLSDGKRASVADLAGYAHQTGAVCAVRAFRADSPWSAADGRPVLLASADDARAIAGAVGVHVRVVPYERAIGNDASDSQRRAALLDAIHGARVEQGLPELGPIHRFTLGTALGAMTPSHAPLAIDLHAGVRLGVRRPAADEPALPVLVALDDPRTVPTPDWDGSLSTPRDTRSEELVFCQRLANALAGDAVVHAELGSGWDPTHPSISAFFLEFSVRLRRSRKKQSLALLEQIESIPLLEVLDETGVGRRVSIAEVSGTHAARLPVLLRPPGFRTLDWQPVLARSPEERVALFRRFEEAYLPSDEDLMQRAARAEHDRARRELMSMPALDPRDLSGLAEHGEITIEVSDPVTGIDVVAALARRGPKAADGPVRVLFAGRPIQPSLDAPFAAVVNLSKPEDLATYRTLGSDGTLRVQAALQDAAVRLAEALIDAASGVGNAGRFLSDPRAIQLYAWLGTRLATLPLEPKLFGDAFYWPTVQGDFRLNDDFWRLGESWYGTIRYADWKRRDGVETDLDRPVLYLPPVPESEVLRHAFRRRGVQLRDVTSSLASLQLERGMPQPPPILIGMPAHPALRARLKQLGVGVGDGELELTQGPGSELHLQLLGGKASLTAPELACPARVVCRAESLEGANATSVLLEELDAALERFLIQLVPTLDALPPFVRAHARRVACARVAKGRSQLTQAPLFVDTTGVRLSLDEIVKKTHEPWAFTTLEPPFPTVKRRCVLMTRDEAKQIRPVVELRLADHAIQRARETLARRTAQQLEYIGLTEAERALCVTTRKIEKDTLTGEVGVLVARAAETRGIHVHVTRRPLCVLDDRPGVALIARVNDDSVKPDRAFARIAHVKRAERLANDVREVARAALEDAFRAPADAIGSEWIEAAYLEGFVVTGRFWLPRDPGRVAPVIIDSALTPSASLRPLHVEPPARGIVPLLPVEGRLLVGADATAGPDGSATDRAIGALAGFAGLVTGLGSLGLAAAARIVENARTREASSPILEAYATHLALLGAKLSAPAFQTSEGKTVTVADIHVELRRRGVIWSTDGRGFVEGEFPATAPGFILTEEGAAFQALSRRLDPNALKQVGSSARPLVQPEITPPVEEPVPTSRAKQPTPRFWHALGERVGALFAEEPVETKPSPLVESLSLQLDELKLAGDPIRSIAETTRGRPVRYDRRRQCLTLCTSHPAVAGLSGSDAVEWLAAAAVSEVNRALVDVTDAEERRALIALLEQG
jgi:hypothetical protein